MTDVTYVTRTTCRQCASGDLSVVLDLGGIVPSNFPRPEEPDLPAIPMTLVRCGRCGFVQLAETVDDESLYRQYWYISGTNETMRAELQSVVQGIGPSAKVVVDVGANDGTLLSYYGEGVHKIAFEPASNLIQRLSAVADLTYHDFFPGESSARLPSKSVDALSSIAMFYDLEDPKAFVAEVDRLLTADGVWVVQFQDLAQQVATTAFDNCCFEHRGYYSLQTFGQLLDESDLHIVHAEKRAINGGSFRIYVKRRRHERRPLVEVLRVWERAYTSPRALELFAWRTQEVRRMIYAAVEQARENAGAVDLYAASTKSSTLLQYCGIGPLIRCAAERTPEKWGRVTSGTRVPIIPEGEWRSDPAPVTLIGAYAFADAFFAREAEYLAGGGQFIVPLPQPNVVSEARRATA